MARRHDLPLTALVEVAGAAQALGFQRSLDSLTDLVSDDAGFLSSDVILSFAKTVAIASRRAPSADLEA